MTTVTTPRTMQNRSPMVELDGGLHVAAQGDSMLADLTTHCGLTSPAHQHGSPRHLPLEQTNCATCREAAMAVPVVHQTSIGRTRLGSSPIKGSRTRYGTVWHCTCGERGQINEAPSRGGRRDAERYAAAHLAEVSARATAEA